MVLWGSVDTADVGDGRYSTCYYTFCATVITTYMQNGGTLERTQQIAAHESLRTTKLYDRIHDEISLDEGERI